MTYSLMRCFLIFSGSLIWIAWGSALYYNMSVTTADGETIRVKDALNHFFEVASLEGLQGGSVAHSEPDLGEGMVGGV